MARFDVNAALKAGYTQSEIDDFMKKNGAVANGQPDNEVARSLTSLENIPLIGSLLSPATKAVRFAGETGAQAVRTLTDPAFRKVAFDPKSLTPDEAAHIQASPKTFLMPEAQIATPLDIVKNGARATAGAASYAVPIGPGLGGAVLSGGAMGALSAASDDNSNLASIGAGGAGGAVGGGLVYGGSKLMGKAINSLSGRATEAADNLTLKGIRPSPSQVTGFKKETGQSMMDVVKKYGLFDKGSEQVDSVINPLQDAFDSIAQSTDKSVSKADLSRKFAEVIKQYRSASSPELQKKGDDLMQYAVNYLGKQGDTIPLANLTAERRVIDKLVKDFKFQPEVAGKNEVIRNVLQDAVRSGAGDTQVGGKSITEIGKELQALRALQPIAERQGNLGKGALNFGLGDILATTAGAAMGVGGGPTGMATGAIAGDLVKRLLNSPAANKLGIGALNAAAPALTRTGELVGNQAGNKVLQTIPAILAGQLGSLLGKQGPGNNENNGADYQNLNNLHNGSEANNQGLNTANNSPIVPQTGDMVQIYDNQEKKTISVPRSDLAKYGITEGQDQAPQADKGMGGLSREQISKAMILDLATTGGKHIAELKTLAEFVAPPKEKTLSNSAENRQQLGQSGLRGLDEVEALLKEGGVDPVFLSSLPGSLGARQYDSAAFRAVEGLLRARSGAAIPEQEVRRYMNANLPRVGDSESTRKAKLKAFRLDLEGVANSKSQGDFMLQQ